MSRGIHFLPGKVMIYLMIGPWQINEHLNEYPLAKEWAAPFISLAN